MVIAFTLQGNGASCVSTLLSNFWTCPDFQIVPVFTPHKI